MNEQYQLGLLHLVHLLVSADGHVDGREQEALIKLKEHEQIADQTFNQFRHEVEKKPEREIYNEGLDLLMTCTIEERMRAFLILHKLAEVDGRTDVKEVRLLLYSMRFAGVDFDEFQSELSRFNTFF